MAIGMTSNNPTQTAEWQALDAAHYIHPFTRLKRAEQEGHAGHHPRRRACTYMGRDGRRILDGMSGLWCVKLGYGRRELADAAIKQMRELPYYNSFFQVAHPPAIELARLLAEVTPPQFKHVFFTGSGSEANDTVVRTVRHYWDVLGQPQRTVIISRHNAYHGSTMAGASLGGMTPMHEQGGLPIPGIVHIRQPYWFGEGGDLSPEEFGLVAARALEEKILRARPGQRRRLHRRADSGCGRRDHPAVDVLARDSADRRQVRHPAGRRRSDLRLRPHRPVVRLGILRHSPRPDAHRQGPVLRLPAHRRPHGAAIASPRC